MSPSSRNAPQPRRLYAFVLVFLPLQLLPSPKFSGLYEDMIKFDAKVVPEKQLSVLGNGSMDAYSSMFNHEEKHNAQGMNLDDDNGGEIQNDRAEVPSKQHNMRLASFEPSGPPIDMDDPSSFSACSLIMDDNHYIIEWLAYHYHVMPLRRVIFLTDPKSKTSPLPILERWKGKIDYTLWSIEDIYPGGKLPKLRWNNPLNHYLKLQNNFITKCLKTLKNENRTWILTTDVDEYVHINQRVHDNKDKLHEYVRDNTTHTLTDQNEPGYILKSLQNGLKAERDRNEGGICVPISRKHFGTIERHESGRSHEMIGGKFNTSYLQTANFKRWKPPI